MKERISVEEISRTFQKALQLPCLITSDDTSVIFYDINYLEERINDLKKQFPQGTLHAIAVKANPLLKILKKLNDLGTGVEVASLAELHLALRASFTPDKIVFDSPAKTYKEIEFALKKGVNLNADSFSELDRIALILSEMDTKSNIGIRINPQVGNGNILSTSVAGKISKFGISLQKNRQKLTNYFLRYKWLNSVHVHIGSQGCSTDLLVDGIQTVFAFMEEVNMLLANQDNRQITRIDIGGGLPVSYHLNEQPITMEVYGKMLRKSIPRLFSGKYHLITEFGRYIYANTAWAASKVEYVKREPDCDIVITHLGADFMLRKCYNPEDWHHEITVLDCKGNVKDEVCQNEYMIAGPLCFSGDVIEKNIRLARIFEDDILVIHDIGAYTLSMWSKYNNRQVPKVIGLYNCSMTLLKDKESLNSILDFWS